MKKLLVVLLAVLLTVTLIALVACGNNETSSTGTNESSTPSGGTSSDPVQSSTPGETSSTQETPPTTPEETTSSEPPVEPKPSMKDPAKEYHVDRTTVKTSNHDYDSDYLYYSNAGSNANERYSDGESQSWYMFNVAGMIEPYIVLDVRQNYLIYVTDDFETDVSEWHIVANFADKYSEYPASDFNENGVYTAGSNRINVIVNPYEYGYYGEFFVVIANCNPTAGNGGTIMSLSVCQWVEGAGSDETTEDTTPGEPKYKSPTMVEDTITVKVSGADEDLEYVYEDYGAATDTRRYYDGSAYGIYRIDLRKFTQPTITFTVAQNYKIEISGEKDGNWVEIANFANTEQYAELAQTKPDQIHASGDYLEGDNFVDITIDPYEYEMYTFLYVKFSDCFPSAGWGAAVEQLVITSWVDEATAD